MSFGGFFQRAIERPQRAPRARGVVAGTLIETLEPRQLLSGHCPANASAPRHPSMSQALIGAVPSAQVAIGVLHQQAGSQSPPVLDEHDTNAATGGTVTAVTTTLAFSNADAVGSAPVERLGTGSSFSGYQYINSDGSPPPPVIHVVEVNANGTLEIISGGPHGVSPVSSTQKKIKPSDVVAGSGSSGPGVTPLAQTPAHSASKPLSGSVGRFGIPTPPVGVTPAVSMPPTPSHPEIHLGAVAVPQSSQVAYIAMPAAAGKVADGLAYASNKAADALAMLAQSDPLGSATSYNFVHFNPSLLLNDALAAFSQESASLCFVAMPTHSTARAWSVTAAVIGLDLLLIGYCYQRNRRQKTVVAALQSSAGAAGR